MKMESHNFLFHVLIFMAIIMAICHTTISHAPYTAPSPDVLSAPRENLKPSMDNATILKISKKLCEGCDDQALEFLVAHNYIRSKKGLPAMEWDKNMVNYAQHYAAKRKGDCALEHSFADGEFTLGENIFWGGGDSWTPTVVVDAWADEQKYFNAKKNTCAPGDVCGHFTQIDWHNSIQVGCAKVVCKKGDTFATCNYYPPGNVIGEKPF